MIAGTRAGVLHVIDSLQAGGAERMAVQLVNALPRERFACHLCTTRDTGPLADLLRPDVGRLDLFRRHRAGPRAVLRLRAYLREHRIRLVHAHGSSLLFCALAAQRGIRMVWHDHDGRPKSPRAVYRLAARRADHVFTVDRAFAGWASAHLGIPEARVDRLPNFAEPRTVAASGPREARGVRVVCVANLRPVKDQLGLVEAFARVRDEFSGTRLLIIGGDGDAVYAAAVRRAVKERGLGDCVELLGARNDVPEILARCDVGVLASRREGFPVALLEYGRAGLAVVATDVGSCGEVLEHGRAGVAVPPGDPGALAAALVHLVADAGARRRLGGRLRARVAAEYSRERVVADLTGVYESLLAGPAQREESL